MERIRIGYMIPYVSVKDSVELGAKAEKYGFDSVWGSDHALSVFGRSVEEQFTLLAIIARETKRVQLGMGVTDPHRRPPIVLAQTANTIDVISNGRLILGLGAGEAVSLTPFGINWDKPVSKLREFTEVIKGLWAGDFFNYDGKFFKYRQAYLANKPLQKPHPSIWIGGQGPRMMKITAELADGWLPYLLTPELYKEKLGQIWKWAEEAGRSRDEMTPGLYSTLGIAKDLNTALETFGTDGRITLAWIQGLTYYSYNPEHKKLLLDEAREVPSEDLKKLCIGSPDDCISKIEKFVKAGATHFVLDPFWDTLEAAKEQQKIIAEKVLPYFSR